MPMLNQIASNALHDWQKAITSFENRLSSATIACGINRLLLIDMLFVSFFKINYVKSK
jgi:hypothetical protein